MVASEYIVQTILSTEDCFCTVTKILAGIFIALLPGNDCVTSVVSANRTGLEGLDGESIIIESADEGTSLGMGRLITGQRGGGERPRECDCEVEEGRVSSNRWEGNDGEGAPP